MRIFHELVVDHYVEDTNTHYAEGHWGPTLGNLGAIRSMVLVDRVSGTTPAINVVLVETPDGTNKSNLNRFLLLSQPLVAGQLNVLPGLFAEDATLPSYGLNLQYGLTGTSPKAHVRIWLTGRGRA